MRRIFVFAEEAATAEGISGDSAPEVLASCCRDEFAGPASPAFLAGVRDRFLQVFGALPGRVVVDATGRVDRVFRGVSF